MKVIIAGGRDITDYSIVEKAIKKADFLITEIVSGGAKGVDTLGEQYAKNNNIPVKRFPADWNKHGRAAGPIRNQEMANYADALIAVWDGKSRGTGHMVKTAKEKGIKNFVYFFDK